MTREGAAVSPDDGAPSTVETAVLVPALDTQDSGTETALSRSQLQQLAIKGASWTLLHTLISVPLAFGVNILIARLLGVTDYGRLAYLTSVMAIADSVISAGVVMGVVQFGSKAHAAGRFGEVARLLSSAQAVQLVTAGPVLALFVVSIADVGPVLLVLALVFGVLLPSLVGTASWCFRIENKTATDAKLTMVVNLFTQAAVVVALVAIGTADSVWSVRLVFAGIAAVLALFFVLPAYRRAIFRPRFRRFPAGFWRFAIPAGASAAISAILASRVEVVVLTWLGAAQAAGLFALAFGVAAHLFAPAQALVGPLTPAVSGLHEVDRDAVAPALRRTLRASSTAVGGLLATALPLFVFLLPLIYGASFAASAPLLVVLGLSGGLMVIVGPLSAFVMARLLGWRLLTVSLAALAGDVLLILLLLPALGVWAAVVGNVVSVVVQLVVLLVGEARQLGLSIGGVVRSIVPYGAGAIAVVAAWTAVAPLGLGPAASAAIAVAGALAVFFGLLWLTRSGLTPGDADAIAASLPRRLRRFGRALLSTCAAARMDH